MGLKPLEFADCLLDSPYFRENIFEHEREVDRTNEAIKGLIKECKTLLKAAENLSKAQRSFAHVLNDFRFECIGEVETDDEVLIADALKEFGQLISSVEDERERMLHLAAQQLIGPLESFRKEQIGGAKEEKKKFDRQTEKYCMSLQNYLSMSPKKKEGQLQEADNSLQMEKKYFHQTALDYVFKLQEVNEKKKFEFVESLLSFIYAQMTFYHSGHEVYSDFMEYLTDLQLRLQNTRERFNATKEQAQSLMNKVQQKAQSGELQYHGSHTRQGYLYVQKKATIGTSTWHKHYCMYTKENKILTMIPYTQTQAGRLTASTDTMVITSCTRRPTDSIDRRFCFDLTALDRNQPILLQSMDEEDRKLWLQVMDGKEPIYLDSHMVPVANEDESSALSEVFIRKCISAIEKRGITDQGLYRIVGVGSKVQNLLFQCIEQKKVNDADLSDDECEWEVKTITSALKQHLRNMPQPLFTYEYHEDFLNAAKMETNEKRVEVLKKLLDILPVDKKEMIQTIMRHLKRVAAHSAKNLMAASNLGVVFGPTLMKSREETMAAIMNLKYQSIVIELMVKEYENIFGPDEEKAEESTDSVPTTPTTPKPKPLPPPKTFAQNNSEAAPTGNRAARPAPASKPLLSAKSYPAPAPPPTGAKPTAPFRKPHATPRHSIDSDEDERNGLYTTVNSCSTPNLALGIAKACPSPVSPRGIRREGRPPAPPPKKPEVVAEFYSRQANPTSPRPLSMLPLERNTEEGKGDTSPPWADKQLTRKSNSLPRSHPPPVPRNPPPDDPVKTPRKVKTLYPCVAENSSELSFEAGVIITNVRESREPGWLEGTLNGKSGLMPSNYVEFVVILK